MIRALPKLQSCRFLSAILITIILFHPSLVAIAQDPDAGKKKADDKIEDIDAGNRPTLKKAEETAQDRLARIAKDREKYESLLRAPTNVYDWYVSDLFNNGIATGALAVSLVISGKKLTSWAYLRGARQDADALQKLNELLKGTPEYAERQKTLAAFEKACARLEYAHGLQDAAAFEEAMKKYPDRYAETLKAMRAQMAARATPNALVPTDLKDLTAVRAEWEAALKADLAARAKLCPVAAKHGVTLSPVKTFEQTIAAGDDVAKGLVDPAALLREAKLYENAITALERRALTALGELKEGAQLDKLNPAEREALNNLLKRLNGAPLTDPQRLKCLDIAEHILKNKEAYRVTEAEAAIIDNLARSLKDGKLAHFDEFRLINTLETIIGRSPGGNYVSPLGYTSTAMAQDLKALQNANAALDATQRMRVAGYLEAVLAKQSGNGRWHVWMGEAEAANLKGTAVSMRAGTQANELQVIRNLHATLSRSPNAAAEVAELEKMLQPSATIGATERGRVATIMETMVGETRCAAQWQFGIPEAEAATMRTQLAALKGGTLDLNGQKALMATLEAHLGRVPVNPATVSSELATLRTSGTALNGAQRANVAAHLERLIANRWTFNISEGDLGKLERGLANLRADRLTVNGQQQLLQSMETLLARAPSGPAVTPGVTGTTLAELSALRTTVSGGAALGESRSLVTALGETCLLYKSGLAMTGGEISTLTGLLEQAKAGTLSAAGEKELVTLLHDVLSRNHRLPAGATAEMVNEISRLRQASGGGALTALEANAYYQLLTAMANSGPTRWYHVVGRVLYGIGKWTGINMTLRLLWRIKVGLLIAAGVAIAVYFWWRSQSLRAAAIQAANTNLLAIADEEAHIRKEVTMQPDALTLMIQLVWKDKKKRAGKDFAFDCPFLFNNTAHLDAVKGAFANASSRTKNVLSEPLFDKGTGRYSVVLMREFWVDILKAAKRLDANINTGLDDDTLLGKDGDGKKPRSNGDPNLAQEFADKSGDMFEIALAKVDKLNAIIDVFAKIVTRSDQKKRLKEMIDKEKELRRRSTDPDGEKILTDAELEILTETLGLKDK